MNPRVKEAILWGVVGLLTFLVLLQGYEILQNVRVDLEVKIGAALVVFLATTVITYLASGRVPVPEEDDGGENDRKKEREEVENAGPADAGDEAEGIGEDDR